MELRENMHYLLCFFFIYWFACFFSISVLPKFLYFAFHFIFLRIVLHFKCPLFRLCQSYVISIYCLFYTFILPFVILL